jgi:hypothetical protein
LLWLRIEIIGALVNTIMYLGVSENVGNSGEDERLAFSQEGFGSVELVS